MSQYYYAVATLPFLSFETERPLPLESFRQICRDWLTRKDLVTVESASISDMNVEDPGHQTLESWILWETSLRNELVRLRAQKRNQEPEKYLQDSPALLEPEAIARSAFALESPLAAEEQLNKARWLFLDDLEVGHYFDIAKLLLYHLRLQILHRKAELDPTKGKARYKEISEQINTKIDEKRTVNVEKDKDERE